MRKLTNIIILFFLFVPTSAFAQWPYDNKPMLGEQLEQTHQLGRPVGFWLMNEGSGNKVFDLSGNGYTGTISGSVIWLAGESGPALTFGGTNDWISISSKMPAFGTGDFTIIAKVKHPADSGHRGILSRGAAVGAGEFLLYKHNSDVLFCYGDNGSISCSLGRPWPDDIWTTVAVIRKGASLTIYQDGVAGNTDSSAGADLNDAASWRIGASDSGAYDWNGDMEYIYIYNRALTASEIDLFHREPFCMFADDDIALMAEGAAPAPTGGQVIMITSLPLLFMAIYLRKRLAA